MSELPVCVARSCDTYGKITQCFCSQLSSPFFGDIEPEKVCPGCPFASLSSEESLSPVPEQQREQMEAAATFPGTELKKLLASWGIKEERDCGCGDHAAVMDEMGAAWCRTNIDMIVGWLMEEAQSRWWSRLLASKWVARRLVLKAITKSEQELEHTTKA